MSADWKLDDAQLSAIAEGIPCLKWLGFHRPAGLPSIREVVAGVWGSSPGPWLAAECDRLRARCAALEKAVAEVADSASRWSPEWQEAITYLVTKHAPGVDHRNPAGVFTEIIDRLGCERDKLRAEVGRLQAENDGLREFRGDDGAPFRVSVVYDTLREALRGAEGRADAANAAHAETVREFLRTTETAERVLAAVRAEHAKLAAFARWAIAREAPCGSGEDKAVELGLLVRTEYDPAVHGEQDADPGDPWFVLAPWLEEKADAEFAYGVVLGALTGLWRAREDYGGQR